MDKTTISPASVSPDAAAGYQPLFEAMDVGFISAEVIRDDSGEIIDWRFLEVNAAIQQQTGFQASELLGRLGGAIFATEREWWLRMIKEVIVTQRSEHIQQYFESVGRWFETIMFPFGPERFAVLYHDITERRRRESNATLLDCVTNELAGLSDPEEIMQKVGALIGDYLGLSSCSFVDVDDIKGEVSIPFNWQRRRIPSLRQTISMKDLLTDAYIRSCRAGQTVVVRETASDERTNGATYARLGIGASITVPFIWQGRWVASTCFANAEPRNWTEEQIALVQEISNRLFLRIERARAEEIVRRSEEKYRTLFETVEEGFCIIQIIFDEAGEPVDWLYLEVNPTFQRQAGFSPVGKYISEFIPNLDRSWFQFYGDVARSGKPARREDEVAAIGRWFSVAAAPVGNSEDIIAVVFDDITIRKTAERALRDSEQIKSFLLGLSDALRPLVKPSEIQEMVTRISRHHFDADRCYYCEVIDGKNVVRRDAAREGLASIAGIYALDEMPILLAAMKPGKPFVIRDVTQTDLLDPWVADLCAGLQILSFIGVPVIKNEELKGLLCIAQSRPRDWTDVELGLAEDIAFRTWNATERANAEQLLERELVDMRSLQEISNRMIEQDNIQPMYDAILKSAMEIMNADGASIQCFITERNELYMLAHRNLHPVSAIHWKYIERDMKTQYWSAVTSGQRVVIPDIRSNPFEMTQEDVDSCRLSGIAAFQNTPLISRSGNHVGLLTTHWNQPHEPSAREWSLLDVLARQAADLIEQRQVQQMLKETRKKLDELTRED